jgi:hypothetical protein
VLGVKTKTDDGNKTMRWDFRRLGDDRPAVLRESARAVTPFGGLIVLVEFWRELGLLAAVRERLPFTYTSPNSIGAAETLLAFWLSVTAGARGLRLPHRGALPAASRLDRAHAARRQRLF